ncbi:uncharacterized protein K441DRAFT_655345 [Cenococcum geophilum 1.58]|uniref:uncharacterized protein n=1 Tax=Cenococcum geophilum 1.58 TaxID=794803 RepID=UPI00358ED1BC|nr:hypothetical protein K441DRAFT_655345 [Cenococcum geophilum 1.58]
MDKNIIDNPGSYQPTYTTTETRISYISGLERRNLPDRARSPCPRLLLWLWLWLWIPACRHERATVDQGQILPITLFLFQLPITL